MIPDYWVDPSNSRDWIARERAGEGSTMVGLVVLLVLITLGVLLLAR